MRTSCLVFILSLLLHDHCNARPQRVAVGDKIEKRQSELGVYFCQGAEWAEPCYHQVIAPPDETFGPQCYDLEDTAYAYNIDAFGPDQGTECKVYNGPNCAGSVATLDFVYPGTADLAQMKPYTWGPNYIGSYECYPSEIGADKI